MSRVSGDFPLQLATRRLVGRRSAVVYSAARLSVCCVIFRIPPARHARLVEDILARILVAFSSDTPNFPVTCYRRAHEDVTSYDATRMLRGNCFRGI